MCVFRDMGHHPEKKSNEVWITIVKKGLFPQVRFQTKRAGAEDDEGFVPVFIEGWEFDSDTVVAR